MVLLGVHCTCVVPLLKAGASTADGAVVPCRYAETDTLKPLLQKHLQYTDSILLAAAGAAGGTAGHWLHEHLYDRCD